MVASGSRRSLPRSPTPPTYRFDSRRRPKHELVATTASAFRPWLRSFRRPRQSDRDNLGSSAAELGMSERPNISIVTPSFRGGRWLPLCISSVADQNLHVEHIVQDAGSDDGT